MSDGSRAFRAAINARLGHACHVLDRFHVIRQFQAGLTAVRRDAQCRLTGPVPADDRGISRARSFLMRRLDKLTAAQPTRRDALFAVRRRLELA